MLFLAAQTNICIGHVMCRLNEAVLWHSQAEIQMEGTATLKARSTRLDGQPFAAVPVPAHVCVPGR